MRVRRGAALVALLSLGLAAGSGAHVAVANRSLRVLVGDADLVVRARIVATDGEVSKPDAGRRPVVRARVLERLKGPEAGPLLVFAQHGHGVATYAVDEEVMLFLRRTGRSRELSALAEVVDWVSLQEHDAKFPVTPARREALVAAVHGYHEASMRSDAADRVAAWRTLTVDLLASGDAALASSALADLMLAPDVALVTPADLPRLEPVLTDTGVSMGVRVALLAELSRRRLVDGSDAWLALLEGAAGSDRRTVIRAVAAHPAPEIRARLVALAADPDPMVAAEAAMALGVAGDPGAIPALESALARPEPRVRSAAVRGLERIPGPASRAALEAAARDHPDAATRRRAEAALRKRDGG